MSPGRTGSRTAIVIPAFNESRSIAEVVDGFRPLGRVIVVDDGSADNTGALAEARGATVVRQEVNRGYTAALATGLEWAIGDDLDFAVTADADGQHGAEHVARAITLLSEGADAVVGIRDRHQRFSETVFGVVGRLRWGILDPLCGIKGYRLSQLASLTKLSSYDSIGTELIIRCALRHAEIGQFHVQTLPREGRSTFGHGLRVEMRILRALWRGLLLA